MVIRRTASLSYGSVDPSRIASRSSDPVLRRCLCSWAAWRLSHGRCGASANDGRVAASLLASRADRRLHLSWARALTLATWPGGAGGRIRKDKVVTACPSNKRIHCTASEQSWLLGLTLAKRCLEFRSCDVTVCAHCARVARAVWARLVGDWAVGVGRGRRGARLSRLEIDETTYFKSFHSV